MQKAQQEEAAKAGTAGAGAAPDSDDKADTKGGDSAKGTAEEGEVVNE